MVSCVALCMGVRSHSSVDCMVVIPYFFCSDASLPPTNFVTSHSSLFAHAKTFSLVRRHKSDRPFIFLPINADRQSMLLFCRRSIISSCSNTVYTYTNTSLGYIVNAVLHEDVHQSHSVLSVRKTLHEHTRTDNKKKKQPSHIIETKANAGCDSARTSGHRTLAIFNETMPLASSGI